MSQFSLIILKSAHQMPAYKTLRTSWTSFPVAEHDQDALQYYKWQAYIKK